MAKKMEENITLDDSMMDIPMEEVQPKAQQKTTRETTKPKRTKEFEFDDEPVNCLRNEKIIVRFVPRPTTLVQNPKHILYGGMAEDAKITYVVPKMSTGVYKNILTDNEKAFLEKIMGLEYNSLSIYKKENNFWDDTNDSGIGHVTLHKQDNYLDLSVPEDYIKYKILLANKDFIAPDLQTLEDRPKATYRFVILEEAAESKMASGNMSVTMQCYKEYGKVENDMDTLRLILETLEGRPVSSKVKLEYLQNKINDHIQAKPKLFLSIITDALLPAKVLIKKSVEAGLIGKKNDCYYLRQDNTPLCEMNEESTLNNAARYISNVKRQELMYMLQAKTK